MSIALAQISHKKATIASLKRDPFFAAEYLSAILEKGGREELRLALSRMDEAFGSHSLATPDNECRR